MTVRDPLDNEPLRTLVGLLQQMTEHVAVHTGYRGITRLSLSHEFGPCVGILPSTSVDVVTAAGRVEIYCEAHPRAEGTFRISAPPPADGPVPPCRPGCERCAKVLRVLGPVIEALAELEPAPPSAYIEPLIFEPGATTGERVVMRVTARYEAPDEPGLAWKYEAVDAEGRIHVIWRMDDPRAADTDRIAEFQRRLADRLAEFQRRAQPTTTPISLEG